MCTHTTYTTSCNWYGYGLSDLNWEYEDYVVLILLWWSSSKWWSPMFAWAQPFHMQFYNMFCFDRNVLIALSHTLCAVHQNLGEGRELFDDLIVKMQFTIYIEIFIRIFIFSFDLKNLKRILFCFLFIIRI